MTLRLETAAQSSFLEAVRPPVLQPLDVSLNKPFKAYVRAEWLLFMEKAVVEAEEAEAELSDDPFSNSDEDEENADVLQVVT